MVEYTQLKHRYDLDKRRGFSVEAEHIAKPTSVEVARQQQQRLATSQQRTTEAEKAQERNMTTEELKQKQNRDMQSAKQQQTAE